MGKNESADEKKREDVALFRYGLVADLARQPLGASGTYEKLRAIAACEYQIPGTSRRIVAVETLRGWVRAYRQHGFDGLKPRPRSDLGRARKLPQEVIDALLGTKEENRKLTVPQVIEAVRNAGEGASDIELPQSTVHRILSNAGLMARVPEDGSANKDRRKFCYEYAGDLWMSDVMHGPSVASSAKSRRYRKTYLIALLDDATRVVTHAQFAFSESTEAFLPVFKKAIMRRGVPQRLYVDNGSVYRSRQLELCCAKLGVTLIHARPYQPQGKGKIERFFRTVRMTFLNKMKVPSSLDELNRWFWAWAEGEYHQSPHRGLEDQTPLDVWAQKAGRVAMVAPGVDLDDLFLWEQKRKVRNDRTVSLNSVLYEVPAEYIGTTVLLRYDASAAKGLPIQVWDTKTNKRIADAKILDERANCFVKRDGATTSSTTPEPKSKIIFTNLQPSNATEE